MVLQIYVLVGKVVTNNFFCVEPFKLPITVTEPHAGVWNSVAWSSFMRPYYFLMAALKLCVLP